MRLSEDVIRYMTVKQIGPLPTPRPSNKNIPPSENEDNLESKEKELVKTTEDSASKKDDSENQKNKES